MQISLRVKEVAQQQGLRLSQIQREARLSITTARRYWYNSRSGLARDAGTLSEINLATLGAIAVLLKVKPGELLEACE
jgi:DNA-binding Xre family transcriptional regulator